MSYFTDLPPEKMWEAMERTLQRHVSSEPTRLEFMKYLRERWASGNTKPGTLGAHLQDLCRFGGWLGPTPLGDVAKDDVVAFFGSLKLGPKTRYKCFSTLKTFFRWREGLERDETPKAFHRFKVEPPPPKILDPNSLVTPEEFMAMLRFCRNNQERALFWMLYEVGPRTREALSVDLPGVQKDQYGYVLHMRSDAKGLKTGVRPLRLVRAAPALQAWLSEHALRGRPDAPLFYGLSNRAPYKRLGYQSLYGLVKRVARDAEIQKNVWPYLMRHTSATNAARRHLPERILGKVYGWTEESRMPSTYVHLSDEDVDEAILRSYGITKGRSKGGDAVKPIICPRCEKATPAEKLFCSSCEFPLVPEAEDLLELRHQAELAEWLAGQIAKLTGATVPNGERATAWFKRTVCEQEGHVHNATEQYACLAVRYFELSKH